MLGRKALVFCSVVFALLSLGLYFAIAQFFLPYIDKPSLLLMSLVLGGSVSAALYLFIHKTFLEPYKQFKSQFDALAQTGTVSDRLTSSEVAGYSELEESINRLLEQVEQTQKDLQQSETRYAIAAAGTNDGLWDWDLKTDEVYYSARWKNILGLGNGVQATTPDTWLNRIHKDDQARVEENLKAHLAGRTDWFESEHRILHESGTYLWVLTRGVAIWQDQKAIRIAGSLTDMTKRGYFDPLTDLPNRNLLEDRLEHAFEKAKRDSQRKVALLFMDLNRFKIINDSLGHHIGDKLLQELAQRLSLCVRSGDTVARLGGDEFVILLENLESDAALMHIVDRIQRYICSDFKIEGHHIVNSSSLGIIPDIAGYPDTSEILRNADIAMYHAKNSKLSYAFFDPTMHKHVVAQQKLEIELRSALNKGELHLVYQPIVSLNEASVDSYEALLRWKHPVKGYILPSDFIPVAEETGLIVPLGEWILREACNELQKQQPNDITTVSVNLSGKQLAQPDLLERITIILQDSGLKANRLKLEITESSIIEDPERISVVLHQLKALGVQLCLDDFGTGYSSLSYLNKLPLDVLKIDRSFIQDMVSDKRSLALVRTITDMATELDMKVVPEGIESLEQVTLLQSLNCHYGQGFYFSRPVSFDEAKKLKQKPKGSTLTV
ncbi:MAG: GGDEF and EAL domain-containing protein [Trueperaceae bacterium]|nr:GGDEF and EAL domain-containing protein [Trueperaceae bacterium]